MIALQEQEREREREREREFSYLIRERNYGKTLARKIAESSCKYVLLNNSEFSFVVILVFYMEVLLICLNYKKPV